jgi:hypothetical protein
MKPEWKKDIQSPKHPDNPTPQFELMGYQEDILQDQKTLKRIMVYFAGFLIFCILVATVSFLRDAGSIHKQMIGNKNRTSKTSPFKNKIKLRVTQTKSVTSLDSFFGKNQAKKGFKFLIISVRIENTADEVFHISPYGIALFADNGHRYNTHIGIKKLKHPVKSTNMDSGESLEGDLLFEVPSSIKPDFLEIKSYNGSLAKYQF